MFDPYKVKLYTKKIDAMIININEIYQFKITLAGIDPPIWRRILIPANSTFLDLHKAIQNSMGWDNAHLHSFTINDRNTKEKIIIGPSGMEYDAHDEKSLPEQKVRISKYFNMQNRTGEYEYDFGDSWKHKLMLEKTLQPESGEKYPQLLDGERACPPEDCGGIPGYYRLLSILKDPENEEYDEMLEWLGGEFDPEKFEPKGMLSDDRDEDLE